MAERGKVRWAVIGIGWISQTSVLPAFANAKRNSVLTALVSSDPAKLKQLGKKYKVENLFSYDQFEECLDVVDAVYIALPNHLHSAFAIRAAERGVHVLCEKPMAMNVDECKAMIEACDQNQVKLMIAYRLHFEAANLSCVKAINDGKIGEPRFYDATFSMQAAEGNYRLDPARGGGPLMDLGVYCINASRYLFQEEPFEVMATFSYHGKRFGGVEEMAAVQLRFSEEKLATFICSFGAADISRFQVVGTKGTLSLEPAFDVKEEFVQKLKVGKRTKVKRFPKRDHFGPELVYFANCVLENTKPEPSGLEGLADLAIIEAIVRSAKSGRVEKVDSVQKDKRPSFKQEMQMPARGKIKLVHVQQPSVG